MPRYTFSCEDCGTLHIEHGFDEPHPEKCGMCGGPIKREWDVPAGIIYKDSGFYSTDKVLSEPINPLDDPEN